MDDAGFGTVSEVRPKFMSHSDPAILSYSDTHLIDTDHGLIADVESSHAIRQAEVGSTKTILKRVKARFDLHPERLTARLSWHCVARLCRAVGTAYGTRPMPGWLVARKIATHIPVFDKSGRGLSSGAEKGLPIHGQMPSNADARQNLRELVKVFPAPRQPCRA